MHLIQAKCAWHDCYCSGLIGELPPLKPRDNTRTGRSWSESPKIYFPCTCGLACPLVVSFPTTVHFPILILIAFLVELGEPPTLLVALSSGRNNTSKITVRLSSSGVTFQLKDAYLHESKEEAHGEIYFAKLMNALGSKSVGMEITDNAIHLLDIHKDTTVSIMVPHSDTSAFHAMVCC